MPGQKITFNPKGLFTNVNQLGKIPEGGLLKADNTVISKPGVIQSRRGRSVTYFTNKDTDASYHQPTIGPRALKLFNAKLRVGGDAGTGWLGTAVAGIVVMLDDSTMLWSPDGSTYSTIEPTWGQPPIQLGPTDGDRHWYAFEQNGTIYIATTAGMVAIGRPLPNASLVDPANPTATEIADRLHSGYYPAGVPWGLSMDATVDTSGVGLALKPDTQAAYRFCFGYRDESGVLHLGAPTTRAVVANAAGQPVRNVKVRTPTPPGIIPGRHFYQLYRSLPSAGAGVDPGDDLGLIYEALVPQASVIDQMSRTVNVVTARTKAAHGYTTGQDVELLSTLSMPGTVSTTIYAITGAVPSQTYPSASAVRRIYSKVNNNGTWADTGFPTFNVVDADGNPQVPVMSPPGTIGTPLLTIQDEVTRNTYYIESGSPWVYVLDSTGHYSTRYSIGFMPALAAYDADARTIHIVGMPNGSDPNMYDFANAATPPRYAKFNVANNGLTYTGATVPLPSSIYWYTGKPYSIYWHNLQAKFCGIWKANANSPGWIVFSVPQSGSFAPPIIVASKDNGASWTVLNVIPSPLATNSVLTTQYSTVYGDSYKRLDTGETVSTFCLNAQDWGSVTGAQVYSEIYYISNNGYDLPTITRSPYRLTTNYGTYPYTQFKRIHTNRTNGQMTVVSARTDGVSWQTTVTFLGGTWIPDTSAGATVIDTAVAAISSSDPFNPFNLFTALSGNIFLEVTAQPNGFIYYASNHLLLDTTAKTVTAIANNAAVVGAMEIIGPSTTATNSVPAGVYSITVTDPTHFTFVANGVDFANTSCNISVEVTSIGFTDTVDPTQIGPYLYTSTVVEGAAAANYPPPLAQDVALFRTFAFYANCTQPANLTVTLLSAAITVGDKIWVGSYYATAGAAESIQNKTFKVYSGGTSLAADIQNTILSLANVVNINHRLFNNVIIPLSSGSVPFASFIIRAIDFKHPVYFSHTDSVGTVISSKFAPYNITVQSVAEPNVLYYSKSNIPDGVPLFNSLRIGQDSKPIKRIVPARDSLFVFKDDGCFILRGYGPPWQVDPFDLTLHIAARDSLVTLDNAVYGLFTRGCFRVSDANVELLSLPIQDQLERFMSGDLRSYGNSIGFGVADNSDHKYMLWLPSETESNSPMPCCVFVFDTFTEAWTKWIQPSFHTISYQELALAHGYQENIEAWIPNIEVETGTFLGYTFGYKADVNCIGIENKTLTDSDLNDGYRYYNAVSYPPFEPYISRIGQYRLGTNQMRFWYGAGTRVYKGDYIKLTPGQGVEWNAVILDDAAPGEWFRVSAKPWIPGNGFTEPKVKATVSKGIKQLVQFAPSFPVSPAATNHFSECALSFRRAYWTAFALEFERPVEESDIAQQYGTVWFDGIEHFGIQETAVVGGVGTVNTRVAAKNFVRTYIPRDQQRGTLVIPGYEVTIANYPVEVDGIYMLMTPGPTSFTRR